MANWVGKLRVLMGADTRGFERGMGRVKKKTSAFSNSIKRLGGVIAGAFAVRSIIRFGAKLVRTNVEFERSMAAVKAISGATSTEFMKLEAQAKKLGETTEFTATQVAGLEKAYALLGFSVNEIVEVTQATLDLATATGSTLADASDVAGSSLRSFGLKTDETGRVIDLMADSFTSSALNLERWSDTMKMAAPIARVAGVEIEDMAASMSILADANIRGSMAGTGLRRIFSELTDDGRPLQVRLEELAARGLTLADA